MTDAERGRPGRGEPGRVGRSEPGRVAGVAQDIIAQLRGIAEGLEGLARVGEHLPAAPGSLPLPGTLSAAQLTTITDAIAAQRRSIEALKAQLSSFDEQLAVLEQIIRPLAEWSSRWAELESRLVTLGRGRPAGKGPAGKDPAGKGPAGKDHGAKDPAGKDHGAKDPAAKDRDR